MLFNSDIFLFAFLPVTLGIYFLLARTGRQMPVIAWLVASSLFFYGWWNPRYLALILASMAINFCIGRSFATPVRGRIHRPLLIVGISFNLALIGYFKYAGFFASSVNGVAGTAFDPGDIVLPLAISFFTFQQIAFLVDAYRQPAVRTDFLSYCFYITFFPQLIAGPIVLHKEILPQLARGALLARRRADLAVGATVFVIGLAKKVIIADSLSVYVGPVFDAAPGAVIDPAAAWTAVLAYTFQLYFDFSGYSDMAIGLGRLFGIRLPINFASPYKATSIIDFWRRWHITLSRFLRDYLYIPLGGNRRGAPRRYVNLMITMVLGGLWHGANWTFVVWGTLHGIYLVINYGWRALLRAGGVHTISQFPPYRLAAHAITFSAVVVGWIFFRARDMDSALAILGAMSGGSGAGAGRIVVEGSAALLILSAAAITFFAPTTQAWMRLRLPDVDEAVFEARPAIPLPRWQPLKAYAAGFAVIGFVAVYMLRGTSEFLYFQF